MICRRETAFHKNMIGLIEAAKNTLLNLVLSPFFLLLSYLGWGPNRNLNYSHKVKAIAG